MKNIGLFTAALLTIIISACTGAKAPKAETLKTGDLIFFGLKADYLPEDNTMATAIADATGKDSVNLIHVAIAEVEADSVWIIDATIAHGCDRHPIDTTFKDFTLKDGSLPLFFVKRLPDSVDVKAAVERAKLLCGQPYDVHFLPDNGALYCSELVRESFLDSRGNNIFRNKPMNFKNSSGDFPQYWVWLFDKLGEPIPQDIPGTNPQDMFEDPILTDIDIDITPRTAEGL